MSCSMDIRFLPCPCTNHVLKVEKCSYTSLYSGTLSSEGCSHRVAVKIYTSKDVSESGLRKMNRLISCSMICKNISPLYGISTSAEGDLFALMPFYETSLAVHMAYSELSFAQSLRFAIDIARGVAELHAVDVLCLNLKPSSLFCHENGSIIIGDYGIRSILKEEGLLTVAPHYAPPEIFTDKSFRPSVECDSWSYGCILLEMFTGKCLWDGMTDSAILNSMEKKELPPYTHVINSRVDTIIRECLEYDPYKRPSFPKILANLLNFQMDYDHEHGGSLSSASINWTKTTVLNKLQILHGCVRDDNAVGVRSVLRYLTQQELHLIFDHMDDCGQTLLHIACNNGAMACVEEFLVFGADPQVVDKNGNSVLHILISMKNTDAALKILQKYKDTVTMSVLNSKRKTPLHLCVETLNTALVSTWADISSETEKNDAVDVHGCGGTALCMAVALNKEESLTLVRVLLDAGANPEAMDGNGQTALHYAAMKDNDELLKLILKAREGTELVNITNGRGKTPLHVALMNGAHSCVQALLSLKASCDIQDDLGENAFHVAATAMRCRGNGTNRDLFLQMLPYASTNAINSKNYRCLKPNDLLKMLPKEFFDEEFKAKLKAHEIDVERGVFEFDEDTDGSLKKIGVFEPCKLEDAQKAGLIDAKWAGGSKSKECTLILIEGDSAMLFAQNGISALGNQALERYGVYPLVGKPPNVTSHKDEPNPQLQHIMCALGLKFGTHKSLALRKKHLRYGHVMFMTDQDHDGFHIKGLLINAFNCYFPSLLRLPGFFQDFTTPIIKAYSKIARDEIIIFKSIFEFESWARGVDLNSWSFKYYKGLASHDPNETTQYFQDMKSHVRSFYLDDPSDSNYLHRAFHKKKVSERGLWIKRYDKGNAPDFRNDMITFGDFINKELILYFIAHIQRSIPSAIDGLKPSQRKVLFVLLEMIPGGDRMKVCDLTGRVSQLSSYHHGLESLEGVIIAMAQSYAGANNINLLEQGGHFGGRDMGGDCHGNPKYLDTYLSPIARLLFPKDDNVLLQHLKEDGLDVEPKCYVPVVPLILINGGSGIATGYSSFVPSYDPLDVINNTRRLMSGDVINPMKPSYRDFNGKVTIQPETAHIVEGVYQFYGTNKIRILELPIGLYYNKYGEFLGTLKKKGTIKAYERKLQDNGKPMFEVELCENMSDKNIMKEFKLQKKFKWHINLLNAKGKIVRYTSIEQVFHDFYNERLQIYKRRKIALVADLTYKIKRLKIQIQQVASTHLQKEMTKLSEELKRLSEADIEIELWKKDLDALEQAVKNQHVPGMM